MFDAAAGFGGYKESGFGREGGKEGLYMHVTGSASRLSFGGTAAEEAATCRVTMSE